jgi:hypothetical protein
MSQYDNEESGYKTKHHHHKEKIIVDEKGYSTTQVWLYAFCCIVVTSFIVLFLVSIIYWSREDNFQHHMKSVIDELITQNTMQTDSKNMVSFSSLAASALSQARRIFKRNRMAVCYTELLETTTPPGDLTRTVTLTTVTNQLDKTDEMFRYALYFKLTMEFDVDVSNYMLDSQHLDQSQRYKCIIQ